MMTFQPNTTLKAVDPPVTLFSKISNIVTGPRKECAHLFTTVEEYIPNFISGGSVSDSMEDLTRRQLTGYVIKSYRNHVRETAARPGQYCLRTRRYGILTRFMESFLYLVGSSILRRQMNTASAGMTPRPREKRHTARR